jgi:hypothetical protein
MRTSKHPYLLPLFSGLLAACGGQPPILLLPDSGTPPLVFGNPDAGPDAGPRDGGYNPTVLVSGVARNLEDFLGGTPVPVAAAEIEAKGVVGVANDTTAPTGGYTMRIPQNGYVTLKASKAGYISTYETVSVGGLDINNANLVIGSSTYVTSIAQAYGVDLNAPFACHAPNPTASQCNYAIVIGRILDDGTENNDGTAAPMGGVASNEFTIKGNNDATWYKKGPYFLSSLGVPSAGYTTSQRDRSPTTNRYRGGIYVTFLEVPVDGPAEQDFQISINSAAGGALTRYFGPVTVKAFRNALAWRNVPQTGEGTPVVPPPPPPPPPNVDFDTQIYPIFLPVNQGGYGCQGCHTDQGGQTPSGGLNLYGGPEIAYQGLDPARYPQRVNTANPTASYLSGAAALRGRRRSRPPDLRLLRHHHPGLPAALRLDPGRRDPQRGGQPDHQLLQPDPSDLVPLLGRRRRGLLRLPRRRRRRKHGPGRGVLRRRWQRALLRVDPSDGDRQRRHRRTVSDQQDPQQRRLQPAADQPAQREHRAPPGEVVLRRRRSAVPADLHLDQRRLRQRHPVITAR